MAELPEFPEVEELAKILATYGYTTRFDASEGLISVYREKYKHLHAVLNFEQAMELAGREGAEERVRLQLYYWGDLKVLDSY